MLIKYVLLGQAKSGLKPTYAPVAFPRYEQLTGTMKPCPPSF